MGERAALVVALLLVAGLWAVRSVAADAAIVGTAPYAPAQGPVLAGQRLVYVPSRQSLAGPVRIEAAEGRRSTVLASLPGEPARTDGQPFTGRSVIGAITATPTALAATVTTVFDLGKGRSGDTGQQLRRTWAGRLGGPMAAVSAACTFPRDLPLPAADGNQVATEGMDCGALEVLDLGNQARRALPPTAVSPVVIAGSLTAWLEPTNFPAGAGAAVVADASGSELLRVPVASVGGDVRLSLDPDGTLVLFGQFDPKSPNAVAIGVATPTQSVPRMLPTPKDSTVRGARLAHGRVATLLVSHGANSVTGGEIIVANVDGTQAHTARTGSPSTARTSRRSSTAVTTSCSSEPRPTARPAGHPPRSRARSSCCAVPAGRRRT
jgi:hypothetical protein